MSENRNGDEIIEERNGNALHSDADGGNRHLSELPASGL